MAKGWRSFILEAVSSIAKRWNNAGQKMLDSTGALSLKSVLYGSRHFNIIKSSYEKLGGCIHSSVDTSVGKFSSLYDKVSGRDAVRRTGVELLKAEQDFVSSQLQRRTLQQTLFDVQKKRNDVNKQLDAVSRADDSFISLITKEHELARHEIQLASQYHEADLAERAAYEKFTSLLRYLHVEERNYDIRMRQWALIGSIIVGILSAFVTWLRLRTPQLKDFLDGIEEVGEVYAAQAEIASKLNSVCALLRERVDFLEGLEKVREVHSSQMKMASQLNMLLETIEKPGTRLQHVGFPPSTETLFAGMEKMTSERKFFYVTSAFVFFGAIYLLSR